MNVFPEAILGLIELLANYLREKNKLRISILFISIIFLLSGAMIIFFYDGDLSDYFIPISFIVICVSILLLISAILGFSNEYVSVKNPFDVELKNLSKEREELKKKKTKNNDSTFNNNVFNTIQLNLNQTTEYYTINKSQARKSFTASVTAIVAGLITILVGIWLIYFKENITTSVISFASGVLLEIIGGMYFHLYNKSLEQLNYFYGKLERMQDIMVAIELANGINDETKKVELQEKIIVKLIERSSAIE
ncbi:TRADD-N-associated membrane domain-containing protein [Aquisalibacillus elongatus]|uniref:Cyanobacterial TRADD-N associated 2 transmembrane domain-containing protein n=1 Tax=Aquisalibacillus elongatus TaxID=485577 RepID=A0A3N5BCB7_9BACI|nr:hypothetical protein [Aquisalibacillus elongatus]RPF55264.1 hypothetical protein EDC24_0135 [Aquisalibacillus elongatus]